MWFLRRRDAAGFAVRLACPDAMAVARDECIRATNFVPAGQRKRDERWLQHLQLSFLSRGRTVVPAGHKPVPCGLAQAASFTSVESAACEPVGITPFEPVWH